MYGFSSKNICFYKIRGVITEICRLGIGALIWWTIYLSLKRICVMKSMFLKTFFSPHCEPNRRPLMVPTAKEKKSKEKTNFIVETPDQTNIIVQLFFSLADLTTCVGNREWVKTLLFKNKMSSHKIICIDYNYIFHEFTVHSWGAYLIVNIVLWWTFLI